MGSYIRGRAIVAALLVTALAGVQFAPASAGTTGGLRGVITDASTQAPLADAQVTVAVPRRTRRRPRTPPESTSFCR